MLFPILLLTFLACAALTLGLAVTMTRKSRSDLEHRLSLLPLASQKKEPEAAAEAPEKPKTNVSKLQRFLLLDCNHPWELKVSPPMLAFAAITSGGAIFIKCHRLLGAPLAVCAAAAGLAAYLGLRFVFIRERSRLKSAFAALFPDAVDAVARMLRAGLPVTAAFEMVCQEAPVPVDAVFATLAGQLRIGMPLEDALRLSSQRIRLPDFQFFAVAVLLQQSAGGNLLPTLEALAQMMRTRRAVQSKARAATAEVRFSAYILGALPFITVGALLVISPGYLDPLFHDPRGHAILAAAAAGLLLSGIVMRQMMRSIEKI